MNYSFFKKLSAGTDSVLFFSHAWTILPN